MSLQTFCPKCLSLLQMYCFSISILLTLLCVCDCEKPSKIICLSVWCYSLFKLLQSLPTTQHIYELSFYLVQCSSTYLFHRISRVDHILLLPSLIDLKRATMRREMIMMMCSTFKSDLFEATKKRIIKPIILLSKKVRHTPTVHKICIVNQLERKITPAQSL